jgi:hypothetical protein
MSIPFEDLCIGFLQHAFNEMQTEGWTDRRNENYARCNIVQEDFERFKINTFSNIMMSGFDGDLDKTIFNYFCYEIVRRGWFTSYCFQHCPELQEKFGGQTSEDIVQLTWFLDSRFSRWLWTDMEGFNYETDAETLTVTERVKRILGLDICLK